MSDLLPLFPLPSTVLFPNVFLPLHIFEPRYREMIADALHSDRLIGMVLLRSGWEKDYEGRPRIFPIGCSGVITHVERLPDGRFNIVLRGLDRFRVVTEDHALSYRRAAIEPLSERPLTPEERVVLKDYRGKLEALLAPAVEKAGADPRAASSMADDELINALAQFLDLDPLEKQALLEKDCLRSRAESLVELLEMKMIVARTPGSHFAH
jgi:Lon protease-like protein